MLPSSEDEGFLFHLYRGNNLLQDGQPLLAREELERALRLSPEDPRARSLLEQVEQRQDLPGLAASVPPSRPPPGHSMSSVDKGSYSDPSTGLMSHPSGVLLVRIENNLACRLSAIHAVTTAAIGAQNQPLRRKTRSRTLDEPLGGPADPLIVLQGPADLALAAPPEHKLLLLSVGKDSVYVRETLLLAFESTLSYESGRLSADSGEHSPMVHLRGEGVAVLLATAPLQKLEVRPDRGVLARADAVAGWRGRLLPRALSASEGPAGRPGFLYLAGEGILFLRSSVASGW